MNSGTRACVAFIAARLISTKDSAGIYDVSKSSHHGFSGYVTQDVISLHDLERNCSVVGRSDDARFHLHDFGTSSEISLKIKGKLFSGYDYGTSKHFNGSVNGSSISLYDYETGVSHNYSF